MFSHILLSQHVSADAHNFNCDELVAINVWASRTKLICLANKKWQQKIKANLEEI